jgi:hypothetical protein
MVVRGATPDTMIIRWGTQAATDPGQVSYRKMGDANFATVTGAPAQDHEVALTGLLSGTEYQYSIQSGPAVSQSFSFQTCPAAGLPMDVVFYGDSRSYPMEHAKVVAQVQAKNPEMVFESGDIVPAGLYSQYLSEFFPVVANLVATTPFMAVPGNHDATSPYAGNYGAIFPSLRPAGQTWQAYYSFICGNVMFIGLDSNNVLDTDQQSYLTGQLRAAYENPTLDHVFVWFHHSAYSPGMHGDNGSVQANWVPLFSDPHNKVTAVFSGHDHLYARMKNSTDVFYIVSGGAGAELYADTNPSAATDEFSKSSYNFVTVHIAGATVTGVAYDDTGTQLDQFNITKPHIDPPPPDMAVPPPDGGNPPPPSKGCTLSGRSVHSAQNDAGRASVIAVAVALMLALARRQRFGAA